HPFLRRLVGYAARYGCGWQEKRMRIGIRVLAIAVSCLALGVVIRGGLTMEKQGEVRHVLVPKAEPRSEDVSTIEGIVKASYETISGGVGVPRQWGRDRTLFAPSVRYIAMSKDKAGAVKAQTSDYQEYVDESDDFLVKQGFTEVELGRKID